jgi:hypothetical protein
VSVGKLSVEPGVDFTRSCTMKTNIKKNQNLGQWTVKLQQNNFTMVGTFWGFRSKWSCHFRIYILVCAG